MNSNRGTMIIIHKIDDFLFNLFPAAKDGRTDGRR